MKATTTHLFSTAMLALVAGACGPNAGAGGVDTGNAADAAPMASPPDARPEPSDPDAGPVDDPDPQLRIAVTPVTFEIQVGESVELSAEVLSNGDDVAPGQAITWVSTNDSVAEVVEQDGDGATVLGRSEGTVTIKATSGDLVGISAGSVLGIDYDTCCQADIDNFCHLPPGTEGCPMTQPGGYCDPDGDGSYDDADWSYGYNHYTDVCVPYLGEQDPEPAQCSMPLPMADNADEPCSQAELEHWRCALSPAWGGIPVSQVCRDYGSGPKYYTFNLNPVACCECSGDFGQACCAAYSPSNGCEGVGDGSDLGGGGGGDGGCVCTNGTDAYGNPVSADCGSSVCGTDGVQYTCSSGQWDAVSSEDSCCAGCTGGTDIHGDPISAHCGETVCGQQGVVYQCVDGSWQEKSAPQSCTD